MVIRHITSLPTTSSSSAPVVYAANDYLRLQIVGAGNPAVPTAVQARLRSIDPPIPCQGKVGIFHVDVPG